MLPNWQALCPAHEDRRASLSVAEGDDGRVLLHCFAGCSLDAICGALSIEKRDLFPPGGLGKRTAKRRQAPRTRRDYPAPEAAADAIAKRLGGTLAGSWTYHRRDGAEAFRVLRFSLTATTSAHGADAPDKTDWKPLAGREVIILPDNNTAGRKYACDVAAVLLALRPPATVKVLDLPGLGDGEDMADYLDRMDAQTEEELVGVTGLEQTAKSKGKGGNPGRAAQNPAHSEQKPDLADLARRLADLSEADRRALAKAIGGE